MRYFIKLAYNGTPFFGWQRQPEQITVQEIVERAFSLLLRDEVAITGCGRTDTGVHASEYFAHFDYKQTLTEEEREKLVFKLNAFLPKEIVIYHIYMMQDDAHARFDAISRSYRYHVELAKNPFTFHFAHRVYEKLSIEKMNEASEILLNTTDFTSFSKVHTQVNNFNCKVTHAQWILQNDQLQFEITADRFLRNMVRAIVGTTLDVGRGKMSLDQFREAIEKKNRSATGTSVPAHALFLENVRYPDDFKL
ncbi:tRNA pseudouridine(38-40) synthase TruA [Bacteroidales bacterium OttesenSCG-928-B11]|nr:tRNA pseudouridine(38-40) synthase TruA [Bacteroidales bacterium OttesenSCG-928-E04]MDL2308220.1 tRNA pseudouridine(38-40) synthase TruA [Bacteroidales bacterium OttesenSCG-928-C03]MDL2311520.1 tRNA pseudouridine(38-40) synthase TruA [Bacteroidales bacterium OttesenSCG-928-B11]MDL2325659.1 tRNA pseudouridine(38-40) synthase TruA [Bacteroidales bacterium OttesenSCG-928-A14]